MTLGLISDTHGLLRNEAIAALHGCGLIVHAGDVGNRQIVRQLEEIAPVVAVRGNIDTAGWTAELPETACAQFGDARIYVLHRLKDLDLYPAPDSCNLIVYGHSHKASQEIRDGVLYVNPGSAGPRRFKLPITVARIDLIEPKWNVSIVPLKFNGSSAA